MKFARIIFLIAGTYGILVLAPLYFLSDAVGRQDPPPISHPEFFYGFVGVALAWQIAFFVIAADPVRLRLMMVPSILEKLSYGIAVIVLYLHQQVRPMTLVFAGADLLFAALFLAAFLKTKTAMSLQAKGTHH